MKIVARDNSIETAEAEAIVVKGSVDIYPGP